MRKLILFILLFISIKAFGQIPIAPTTPVQLTTVSQWYEPSTGYTWMYRGATYSWMIETPLASPFFIGNPQGPTPLVSDSTHSLETTAGAHQLFALNSTVVDSAYFKGLGTSIVPITLHNVLKLNSNALQTVFGTGSINFQNENVFFTNPVFASTIEQNYSHTITTFVNRITFLDSLGMTANMVIWNKNNEVDIGSGAYHGMTGGSLYVAGQVMLPGVTSGTAVSTYGVNSSGQVVTFTPGGVTSFNTRTGVVTLLSSDVTTALSYTPEHILTFTGSGLTRTGNNITLGSSSPLTQDFNEDFGNNNLSWTNIGASGNSIGFNNARFGLNETDGGQSSQLEFSSAVGGISLSTTNISSGMAIGLTINSLTGGAGRSIVFTDAQYSAGASYSADYSAANSSNPRWIPDKNYVDTHGGGSGITTIAIASSNGFTGTSSGGTTPTLTLATSVTGLLKGNGTAISAATAGTDYLTPTGSAAGLTSFPTLNQNTTGTAANITGSSNSTITTLSALSLPYSQLTGAPSLSGYQLLSNLETTLTNSTTLYPSGSAVQTYVTGLGYAPPPVWTAVKTGSYTLVANDAVPTDATSGTVPLVLPIAPANGTIVWIKQVAGTNTTTIAAGGSDVFNTSGGVTSITVPGLNSSVQLQYKSGIWYAYSVSNSLAFLDLRYSPLAGSSSTVTVGTITSGIWNGTAIANANLANSAITINGTSVSLGGTRTLTLASADFANQGTTTTVLHGNGSGNPSFAQIAIADLSATGTPSSSTYLRGDNTWATVGGSGTVTSIIAGTGLTGGTITTSGTIAIDYTATNTWTGVNTFQNNTLSTTTADEVLLFNTTAATVGAQKVSPGLNIGSNGWGTTGGTSQSVNWRFWSQPVQATVPTGTLNLDFSVAGGAYSNKLNLTSAGNLTVTGTATTTQVIGGLTTGSNTTTSNFSAPIGSAVASGQATAQLQFFSSTSVQARAWMVGTATTGMTANNAYANFIIGSVGIAMPATGTAPGLAQLVINPFGTITNGSAIPITNTTVLFVGAAAAAGTNNYTAYFDTGNLFVKNGNINLSTAGNKILIATGTNASAGTATLSSGTVTVSTTAVTASSLIFVVYNTPSGTLASGLSVPVGSITAGTSFVINSLTTAGVVNTLDNSTVRWWFIN